MTYPQLVLLLALRAFWWVAANQRNPSPLSHKPQGINNMSISIRTFGSKKPTQSARDDAANESRPKAEFWLNIGYVSDVKDDDGSLRFVSLSTGIPLDTLEDLPVNSRNKNYAFFNQARNELRDELLEQARKLTPGEEFIMEGDPSGLTFQIRRVADEAAPPTGENPFRRK